jgi:plasmid stability protein
LQGWRPFLYVWGLLLLAERTRIKPLVRGIESDLVRELKLRAARHGHSAEEEHRQILREGLRSKGSSSLKGLLLAIPDVGEDLDFERLPDRGRSVEL